MQSRRRRLPMGHLRRPKRQWSAGKPDPTHSKKQNPMARMLYGRVWWGFCQRWTMMRSVQETEWKAMQRSLLEKKKKWNDTTTAILIRGNREWMRAQSSLSQQRQSWIDKFEAQYKEKTTLWDLKYIEFMQN